MPRAVTKDSFQAAVAAVLKPALAELGFRPCESTMFVRISDEILQFIHLRKLKMHLFAGAPTAELSFGAMAIFEGATELRLRGPGDTLGTYSAPSIEEGLARMSAAVDAIKAIAVPWFVETSTRTGFADAMASCRSTSWETVRFVTACCRARLEDTERALQVLALLDEPDARAWVREPDGQVAQLRAALLAGTHQSLLSSWYEKSVVGLKLARVAN